MYYGGKGVTQNYETAIKWYKLAAKQGLAKAQNHLERLQKKFSHYRVRNSAASSCAKNIVLLRLLALVYHGYGLVYIRMAGHEVCGDFMFGRRNWFTHQLTSILPHFLASSRNETSSASSDGFCIPVVVFNRGVEFASLSC